MCDVFIFFLEHAVNVRSVKIFRILKKWCWSKECLCRQRCFRHCTRQHNDSVWPQAPSQSYMRSAKQKLKRYSTKYCKRISVRASTLSPFINEQVFVSRQRIQNDSIRLLDKWLLHLLQGARRKHKKQEDRSLCCSSTAATIPIYNNRTQVVIEFSCSFTTS